MSITIDKLKSEKQKGGKLRNKFSNNTKTKVKLTW